MKIYAAKDTSSIVKELSRYIGKDLWVRVHVGEVYDYWIKVISVDNKECKCYAADIVYDVTETTDAYYDLEESMQDIHTIATKVLSLTGDVLTTEELFDKDNDNTSW